MLNFFNRPQRRYPTIRQALVQSGLAEAADPTRVALVEKHGNYAGRRVNFFQAFEPGHQDLLLGSGHVEPDGTVVVDNQPAQEGTVPVREPANRATHADDERLVFWDPGEARRSEASLSAPAATWQQARTTSIPRAST
jgi:hypothetical protein